MATWASDGSRTDVQDIHDNDASAGDTITIPAGTFTWTASLSITKAIHLAGAGSGRIIGNTKSTVTIGTGTQNFTTTQSGLPITAGQTLRVAKMPNRLGHTANARENYMEGTVTSYSGTALVMNITSTGGSGSWRFWWIATDSDTIIINDYNNGVGTNAATQLIVVTEPASGNVEISGIKFEQASTGTSASIGLIASAYVAEKTLIHDCWFQVGVTQRAGIYGSTMHALIWECSFDNSVWSANCDGMQFKWNSSIAHQSWSTNSTMGMDDTDGATNVYVEDCDFHAFLTSGDFDDNLRYVWRYNIHDNCSHGPHGADTSPKGVRHWELYNNELIFDVFAGGCEPEQQVQWFFWGRGGTGVITDNVLPAITSTCGGSKGNVLLSALNTRRDSSPFCCWTSYPAPHQPGQGYGPGATFHSYTSSCAGYTSENHSYYTYLEPIYVWNNTGTAGNSVELNQDTTDECANGEEVADYIQSGRDYYNDGTAKPGYTKFTYPHPLRSEIETGPSLQGSNLLMTARL